MNRREREREKEGRRRRGKRRRWRWKREEKKDKKGGGGGVTMVNHYLIAENSLIFLLSVHCQRRKFISYILQRMKRDKRKERK